MPSAIKRLIKHEAQKWGCFLCLAILVGVVTLLTGALLRAFEFDQASSERIADKVGEYLAIGILGLMFVAGVVMIVRERTARLRAGRQAPHQPPPLPKKIARRNPYPHGHRPRSRKEKW